MEKELSYDQIYKALLSEGIETYVPDGVSISHPVVDLRNGRVIDCFLLFAVSPDGSKYTVPTARILIDSEKKKLLEFHTMQEMPFSVYDGTDYFVNNINDENAVECQEAERNYQTLYLRMREIAFKETISANDKEAIVRYIKTLRTVELKNLQPYLFELGLNFFEWGMRVIRSRG